MISANNPLYSSSSKKIRRVHLSAILNKYSKRKAPIISRHTQTWLSLQPLQIVLSVSIDVQPLAAVMKLIIIDVWQVHVWSMEWSIRSTSSVSPGSITAARTSRHGTSVDDIATSMISTCCYRRRWQSLIDSRGDFGHFHYDNGLLMISL